MILEFKKMKKGDPKGYYAILEVSITATADEIKVAYRRRAMELHPDRNNDKDATAQFQLLGLAYAVLSDPAKRAAYDTDDINLGNRAKAEKAEAPPEPIVCSCCGKVSAQPRYVIFYEVKSFIIVCTRTAIQGIFCSACADKKSVVASTSTWFLGWWSFAGFMYSAHAILTNLFGGERPALVNAKLAGHQAWVFGVLGQIDMARAIALDARGLAQKIRPPTYMEMAKKKLGYEIDDEGERLRKQLDELISMMGAGGSNVQLKNSWALLRRPFFIQGAFVLVALAACWAIVQNQPQSTPPQGPKPYVANMVETTPPAFPSRPSYVRPSTAPDGELWPSASGYLPGYALIHANGLSEITIDNSQNNADVFVKLVSLDGPNAFPVRTFFIRGGSSFTLEHVTVGNYDIRYRDLNTGHLSRSEQFLLEEIHNYNGVQYTTLTMTLYKVRSGNLKTYDLSENEF